jgi:SSS family solute:Na+ symporter/sodium/pantothenate symporter
MNALLATSGGIVAIKAILIGAYLLSVYWLSWVGMRKTKSLAGFAVGNKDMGPVLVGIVMASSIASTATFVINPGFVYTHGLAGFLHYAVAAQAGIAFGLIAVTKGFRRVGDKHQCLTIPDWIHARYGSSGLALFFALINLLSITFVVLIMVGCALLLTGLVGLSYEVSLVAVLVVVFSYVLMGGTYAHAYTNAVQAIMMAVVAMVLFASGLHHFDNGFLPALQSVGDNYAAALNPDSDLYYSTFSVFVSGFIVTFALMMQPHILTKVLYLKSDKDVNRFLITSMVTGAIFSLVLFVGFYAKLDGLVAAKQDAVVTMYVASAFGETFWGQALTGTVFVALLAAGMSTLDGILVALSAMVTHDLYFKLRPGAELDPKGALMASRIVLVAVGLISFVVALDPPQLVGLFAQKGVYGLAAASFVPIVFGVLVRGKIPAGIMAMASGLALVTHLVLHLLLGVTNPAVSSCYAIIASVLVALIALAVRRASASDATPPFASPAKAE